MPDIIVSTCGTSVLNNQAPTEIKKQLTDLANSKIAPDMATAGVLCDWLDDIKESTTGFSDSKLAEASAELSSLFAYYNSNISKAKIDRHILLSTDTWLGERAAQLIEALLRARGVEQIEVRRQHDLQTQDFVLFRSALSDLVKWCEEELEPQRSDYCRVIFNLSGGFKSETGFMQALGMFFADETIYMFERSSELMRIPRLPVELNAKVPVCDDIEDFRRASNGLSVNNVKNSIYWFEISGEYGLTPWGELVFTRHKDEIYGEHLLSSPSEKIRYGEKLRKSLEGLPAGRLREINTKIDLLAKFKENDNHPNPSSLHYHVIKHPKDSEITHEIYAWSDGDAKRIYCHENGGVTELLYLGDHL